MSKFTDFLETSAPTIASVLLGPVAGMAVSGLGKVFGIDSATMKDITKIVEDGKVSPDQLSEIRKLELEYQDHEKERGFRYADLEFRDRDSARKANVAGGTQVMLFWLSLVLLGVCLGMEGVVLFKGYPVDIPEIIVGRVLGLADSVVLLVSNYWYGSSLSSARKSEVIAAQTSGR